MLLPHLRSLEAGFGAKVRFIDGALSNISGSRVPRTVVTYARNRFGSTATTFDFEDIFPSGLFDGLGGEDSTPALATAHPCGGLARRQCRDKFLAAMQGVGED